MKSGEPLMPDTRVFGIELQPMQIGLLVAFAIFATIIVAGRMLQMQMAMRRSTRTLPEASSTRSRPGRLPSDLDQNRASRLLDEIFLLHALPSNREWSKVKP